MRVYLNKASRWMCMKQFCWKSWPFGEPALEEAAGKWTWREYLSYKYLDVRAFSSWWTEMILMDCDSMQILRLLVTQLSEMEETWNPCTSYLSGGRVVLKTCYFPKQTCISVWECVFYHISTSSPSSVHSILLRNKRVNPSEEQSSLKETESRRFLTLSWNWMGLILCSTISRSCLVIRRVFFTCRCKPIVTCSLQVSLWYSIWWLYLCSSKCRVVLLLCSVRWFSSYLVIILNLATDLLCQLKW